MLRCFSNFSCWWSMIPALSLMNGMLQDLPFPRWQRDEWLTISFSSQTITSVHFRTLVMTEGIAGNLIDVLFLIILHSCYSLLGILHHEKCLSTRCGCFCWSRVWEIFRFGGNWNKRMGTLLIDIDLWGQQGYYVKYSYEGSQVFMIVQSETSILMEFYPRLSPMWIKVCIPWNSSEIPSKPDTNFLCPVWNILWGKEFQEWKQIWSIFADVVTSLAQVDAVVNGRKYSLGMLAIDITNSRYR